MPGKPSTRSSPPPKMACPVRVWAKKLAGSSIGSSSARSGQKRVTQSRLTCLPEFLTASPEFFVRLLDGFLCCAGSLHPFDQKPLVLFCLTQPLLHSGSNLFFTSGTGLACTTTTDSSRGWEGRWGDRWSAGKNRLAGEKTRGGKVVHSTSDQDPVKVRKKVLQRGTVRGRHH